MADERGVIVPFAPRRPATPPAPEADPDPDAPARGAPLAWPATPAPARDDEAAGDRFAAVRAAIRDLFAQT